MLWCVCKVSRVHHFLQCDKLQQYYFCHSLINADIITPPVCVCLAHSDRSSNYKMTGGHSLTHVNVWEIFMIELKSLSAVSVQ